MIIKDAAGQDVRINDLVWVSGEGGEFFRANLLEINNDYLVLMTKSNSVIEIDFAPKKSTPSTNRILRG